MTEDYIMIKLLHKSYDGQLNMVEIVEMYEFPAYHVRIPCAGALTAVM